MRRSSQYGGAVGSEEMRRRCVLVRGGSGCGSGGAVFE